MTLRGLALVILTAMVAALAVAQPSLPKARGFDTSSIGIDQRLGQPVPFESKWTDESGKVVTLGTFFEDKRPVIVIPVFYRCTGVCEVVLDESVRAVNALHAKYPNENFEVVVFSINPKETQVDAQVRESQITAVYENGGRTPEERDALRKYALDHWHFLTGDLENITALTTAIGFRYTYEPKIDRINHAAGIMVVSPEGKLTNYFYGKEYTAPLLKTALDQSREERVSPPAQPILLGCFMVDPETGRWSLVVGRALQVGGMLTVVIMLTSIFFMTRGAKRHPRRSGGGGA